MRADICEPDDTAAVERFRSALRRLGAVRQAKDWMPDCDIYRMKIGDDELAIFCDQWSLDIEGPDDLVHRVLSEYEKTEA
jgi:hypothetical protein